MPDGEQTTADTDTQAQQTANTESATGTNGEDKRFSQAELDAIVKDRLERHKRATESAATKAAEEAEAARLKEQGEWQKAAETHEAKVKELAPQVEGLTTERDALSAIVVEIITAATKEWPAEVKALLPGDDADVLTRYAAMARTEPLAKKLADQAKTPGNGPNPPPNGAATDAQQSRERMAQFQRGRI